QLELLAQRHVHRPVPIAHRCGQRTLESQSGAPDRIEGGVGERGPRPVHRAHPAVLLIPIEGDPERIEDVQSRSGDLGADSVAGDEGRLARHGNPGVRFFIALVSAVHGSPPSPHATVRKPTRPLRTSAMTTVSSAVATPPGVLDRLYANPAGMSANRPPPASAAMPAVGSGVVGSGVGCWGLPPHPTSVRAQTTHHAPRTKFLICKGLVTARNIVCAPRIFKKPASDPRQRR